MIRCTTSPKTNSKDKRWYIFFTHSIVYVHTREHTLSLTNTKDCGDREKRKKKNKQKARRKKKNQNQPKCTLGVRTEENRIVEHVPTADEQRGLAH